MSGGKRRRKGKGLHRDQTPSEADARRERADEPSLSGAYADSGGAPSLMYSSIALMQQGELEFAFKRKRLY